MVFAICLVACATLIAFGGTRAAIVPDTASYFRVGALPGALAQPRTPIYMWLTGPLYFNGFVELIPWLHLMAFVSATLLLEWQCRLSGFSRTGVVSVCLALMTSTALFKITNQIVPESLALSFGLSSLAATLCSARSPRSGYPLLGIFLATGVCYLLRPIYLPLMLALPALHYFVSRNEFKKIATLAVLIAAALPFILFSSVRYHYYRDFNVVSFGGYQASAIASFMLTPDLINRLPVKARHEASRILALRTTAENAGTTIGVPKNAEGERSFASAAIVYPDALARSYDDVLSLNGTIREKAETWLEFNARLMKTDIAVFKSAPLSYADWVVGATARFVGHAIIINPSMLIAVSLLVLSLLLSGSGIGPDVQGDVKLMTAIALAIVFGGGLLSVTTSFPAQRYIDSASVLLSAIPFLFFVKLMGRSIDREISQFSRLNRYLHGA